eukprot:g38933.t1
MYPRLLWEVREEIAGALEEIFNTSLVTGEVPYIWRIVNVDLLLKKYSRDRPGDFDKVTKYIDEGSAVDVLYMGFRIGAGTLAVCYVLKSLDMNVEDTISKFADDLRIGGVVDGEEDGLRIKSDIDQL